jgi:hypothetical protein
MLDVLRSLRRVIALMLITVGAAVLMTGLAWAAAARSDEITLISFVAAGAAEVLLLWIVRSRVSLYQRTSQQWPKVARPWLFGLLSGFAGAELVLQAMGELTSLSGHRNQIRNLETAYACVNVGVFSLALVLLRGRSK